MYFSLIDDAIKSIGYAYKALFITFIKILHLSTVDKVANKTISSLGYIYSTDVQRLKISGPINM